MSKFDLDNSDKLMDFLEEYFQIHGYPPLPFEIDSESNEAEDEI